MNRWYNIYIYIYISFLPVAKEGGGGYKVKSANLEGNECRIFESFLTSTLTLSFPVYIALAACPLLGLNMCFYQNNFRHHYQIFHISNEDPRAQSHIRNFNHLRRVGIFALSNLSAKFELARVCYFIYTCHGDFTF